MPSSSPDADTATATLGSESLLQASLRISALMSRSIGPVGGTRPGPGAGDRPACPAGGVETCVTWAITSIGRPVRPLPAQAPPRRPVFGSPDAPVTSWGGPAYTSLPSLRRCAMRPRHIWQEITRRFAPGKPRRGSRPPAGAPGQLPVSLMLYTLAWKVPAGSVGSLVNYSST